MEKTFFSKYEFISYGRKTFINNQEKTVLKLHDLLNEWKDKLYETITEIHK